MKKLLNLLFLGLLVFCVSCGDEAKSGQPVANSEQSSVEQPDSKHQPEKKDVSEMERVKPVAFDGRYRKLIKDQPATDCNCNCIDVDFEKPSEWCIVKDKIYISAQCKKTGDHSVDIYFVGVSRENAPDRRLPWKDFDIDKPIASIAFEPNGDAKLDWKGFTIDGEIATDYAIYGKKTLEGTYKRD